MKGNFVLALLVSLIASASMEENMPQFPVIGVITLDYRSTGLSYVNDVYVKFVQMSGGQVVPLFAFSSTQSLLKSLRKINGVIFPGGSMNIYIESNWRKNVESIYNYAIQQNDDGNIFPLIGMCLGLEIMPYFTSGKNGSIFTRLQQPDDSQIHPLILTDEKTELYGELTNQQRELVSTEKGVLYFNHNFGLTPETYHNNEKLKKFWKVTAWANNTINETFAASIQAREYPFFGLQFHPELTLFESRRFLLRTKQSIEVAKIFSRVFVELAKKNKNHFASLNEFMEKSINNFQGTSSPRKKGDSSVIYLFDESIEQQIS